MLAWLPLVLGHASPASPDSGELPPVSGAFNVKDYGAKGDGKADDTESIQKAFLAVKRHYQLIYFPAGTYLLSDTIGWRNFLVVRGQGPSATILRLKDACPGYDKPQSPKAVVRCLYNKNESIGNYISHLAIETGKGNPGAIGLRYNAHNQGLCESVTIRSGDGKGVVGLDLSESEFGPAFVTNVTVEGFEIGIKTPGAPSHATLENVTIKNQGVAGIENHFPLSVRKLTSTNAVPAIVNRPGCLSQLVLLDSKLSGGGKAQAAIDSDHAALYIRGVTTAGYGTALKDDGKSVPGPALASYITGELHALGGAPPQSLALPIEDPPEPFSEPSSKWTVVDNAGDSTQAIQSAIDSGATTLFFKPVPYRISDTIHVRGKVRRIVGAREGTLTGEGKDFGLGKPMLRFDGPGKDPITVEHLGLSTWPHPLYAIEMATSQTVHLKCVYSSHYIELRNTAMATGKLFVTEGTFPLKFTHPQSVWIRHFNVENNPFDPKRPLPTYLVNQGGTVWILGMKTESPAFHTVTSAGGRTEVLGGFFRDHFENTGTPYFTTDGGETAATYTQYAWAPGKSRDLEAVEARGSERRDLRTTPENHVIGLYSSLHGALPKPK